MDAADNGVSVATTARISAAPDSASGKREVPELQGDIRPLVPKLGLREYWYPGILAREVRRRRPVRVRMLGDDICFFWGRDGAIAALNDICPHRGARLSEGRCHFAGTVTCPYHGWTFDQQGRNVAVLSEGPDSRICGKPGTEARTYPTKVLHGIVFVWMGHGEPVPIEEDVPEEFFQADVHVLTSVKYWPVNWEVGLENSMDSHVPYLHIDAWMLMLQGTFIPFGAVGERPVWVGNGFTGPAPSGPTHAYFPPLGGQWPKSSHRRLIGRLFKPLMTSADTQHVRPGPRWTLGHHLPGMYRQTPSPGSFDFYTRTCVPIDEENTRVWYYHTLRAPTALQRLAHSLRYRLYMSWLWDEHFSKQDAKALKRQRWDMPETLSPTDTEVVQWRRLVVTKHFGGRDAKFRFNGPSLVGDEGLESDAG